MLFKYLLKIYNNSENLEELLKIFIEITESTHGSVFLINKNHSYESLGESTNSYKPTTITDQIFISNNPHKEKHDYITPNKIENIIIIPICNSDILGVIILINRKSDYDKDIINTLKPYLSLLQLILQKEKIERELKKIKENELVGVPKDIFLENISHKIKIPLNGIIENCELLSSTGLNVIQKKYNITVEDYSIQLIKIINDTLDFSKLLRGKVKISYSSFSIKDIINIVNNTIEKKIVEKKQKLKFNIDKSVPKNIVSDKEKIIQVLINLISNSNTFTNEKGIINVSFNYNINNLLEVSVSDNGIGISNENQLHIFNSFIDSDNKKNTSTLGVGLYISKKLVELLEGDIKVVSFLNKGSTFIFNVKIKT
jgi:signal transduction histidine kinase